MKEQDRRFWSKVRVGGADECWEWHGARNRDGYGRFFYDGRNWHAHRLAWMFEAGLESMPLGVVVCHRCDNRRCVNPAHMFAGTQRENIADAMAKGRMQRGERSGTAKLTAAQIPAILQQVAEGHPLQWIAAQFGVGYGAIHAIKHGVTWGHVPNEERA